MIVPNHLILECRNPLFRRIRIELQISRNPSSQTPAFLTFIDCRSTGFGSRIHTFVPAIQPFATNVLRVRELKCLGHVPAGTVRNKYS